MSRPSLTFGSRLRLAAASLAILAAGSGGSAAPGTAGAARPSDDPAWPAAAVANPAKVGFTATGLAALDARMARSIADQDFAGMVYILARGGEVAAFGAHGVRAGDARTGTPMTRDTLFRIYSMTKPITGVAMMQLYEKGLWRLDDPVTKYVAEFANLKVLTWKDGKPVIGAGGQPVLADPPRPPTMREIMSHTAGFDYGLCCADPKGADWNPAAEAFVKKGVLASANLDEMVTRIAGIPLSYPPGTRWHYSVSVDIQGYIAQKLSGRRFGEYLKAHVFTPLGMNDTALFVGDARKPRFADVYRWDTAANGLVVLPERPDRSGFTEPSRLESGGRRPGQLDARLRAFRPDDAQPGHAGRRDAAQA